MKEMNHNTEPTSVEIPNLWTLFINDLKEILEYLLNLPNKFTKCIKKTMKLHERTIPMLNKGLSNKTSRTQILIKYGWLAHPPLVYNKITLSYKK